MKILLATLNSKYIHLNLAIRLLYALNKDRGGLEWKEFTIKEDPADIAGKCEGFEVIAFSCYIWNITQTLKVARTIKSNKPSVKILLGGPEVSYEYNDLILLPEVDYIMVGEGEIPFALFLDQFPHVQNVPNLVYMDQGEIHFRPQQVNFDLSLYRGINPYQYDDPEELSNKICYVETSRGCPYKCEFCLASLDNNVRYLPLDDIKSNLLYLMQHGRVIKFLDRTFNVKRDFTLEIFRFILDNHRPGNVFQFEITADIVHPDIVAFIQQEVPPGLFRFEIGIQTVNQKSNLAVSRKQNFNKTSAVIKKLDAKIDMHLDLIVGLPYDEWDDIRYSFEEVFKLFPHELQLGFLKFLKGTPVRYKLDDHAYVYDPEPPYQIIESRYLSRIQLNRIAILEEALEIFWNKKRAKNCLRYVTAQYGIFGFLLGLGEHFIEGRDFHKHSLFDIYDSLFEYIHAAYTADAVFPELAAIDYYLQAKIKPQVRYLQEIPYEDRLLLTKKFSLNHHQHRYLMIPVHFDFKAFTVDGIVRESDQVLIFKYTGVGRPELFSVDMKVI